MLQNAHLLVKIGADTAENEQHFAEILPTDALTCSARPSRGSRRGAAAPPGGGAQGPRGGVSRSRGPPQWGDSNFAKKKSFQQTDEPVRENLCWV